MLLIRSRICVGEALAFSSISVTIIRGSVLVAFILISIIHAQDENVPVESEIKQGQNECST